MRSREKFHPSVGTVDSVKTQMTESQQCRNFGKFKDRPSSPVLSMLSRFASPDRMVDRRPLLADTRLGQQSRANPRSSRFKEWPSVVLGGGETSPHDWGASSEFAFPEFGIFLA